MIWPLWHLSHSTAEREYVDLMYKATACYASWDPLRPIRVGDYGKLQDDGSFAPHGNIFVEGFAEKHKIQQCTDGQDECRYIVSDSGSNVSLAPDVDVSLESVIEGHLKHKVAFTKGRGALLAMLKPRLHAIAYPGRLSRLLNDQHEWGDMVIVSEVYTCRSYARLLTHHTAKEITVGLGATVPVAVAVGLPISVGGDVDVQWQTDATRGDWKAAHFERMKPRKSHRNGDDAKIGNEVNEDGPLCYPLFKLVALRRPLGAPISAVRGTFDYELPVAIPPWINDNNKSAIAEEGTEEEDDGEERDVGELSEEEMKQGEEDKREGNEQVRKPWWNATVGRSLSCVHWASQAINNVIESLSRHH